MKRSGVGKYLIPGFIIYIIMSSSPAFTEELRGPASDDTTVMPGKKVSIEYSLSLEDRSIVDSNKGTGPLSFIHGARELLPALENALAGMKIGESKQITVMPEDGYGPIDKNAIIELDKEQFLQDELEIGTVLQSLNSDDQPIYAQVAEIKEKTILLDFNHPLAGKTLYFDIKILDIQ